MEDEFKPTVWPLYTTQKGDVIIGENTRKRRLVLKARVNRLGQYLDKRA